MADARIDGFRSLGTRVSGDGCDGGNTNDVGFASGRAILFPWSTIANRIIVVMNEWMKRLLNGNDTGDDAMHFLRQK